MTDTNIAVRRALRIRDRRERARQLAAANRDDCRDYWLGAKEAIRGGFPELASRYLRLFIRNGGDLLGVL